LAKAIPTAKPGSYPVNAGQIYRFATEAAIGDIVVYRPSGTAVVHLGEITGPFVHDASGLPDYANRRAVHWLREASITAVSQGALYELGSILTFFQVKNYADEWEALLAGKGQPPEADDTDETVAAVTETTEQAARDFIRKRLTSSGQKGHPFAQFVGQLLRTMGYRTRVSPPGADGGIDIVAHRDELGFEPPVIKVQVKSGEGPIGGPPVAELLGNLGPGEFGLFVTLGTFTPQAKAKAASASSRLRLVDGEEVIDLVLLHYEEMEPAYKSLLPMRRMYLPQTIAEG